jgi:hypothetical protein
LSNPFPYRVQPGPIGNSVAVRSSGEKRRRHPGVPCLPWLSVHPPTGFYKEILESSLLFLNFFQPVDLITSHAGPMRPSHATSIRCPTIYNVLAGGMFPTPLGISIFQKWT